MISLFKNYINNKIALTDKEWALIESVCAIEKLRKQQFLLEAGDVWRYNAFVCQGCLRRYKTDAKGVEHIIQFAAENAWTGDRSSLMKGTPSEYNIDAIEASVVLLIKKEDLNILWQASQISEISLTVYWKRASLLPKSESIQP